MVTIKYIALGGDSVYVIYLNQLFLNKEIAIKYSRDFNHEQYYNHFNFFPKID